MCAVTVCLIAGLCGWCFGRDGPAESAGAALLVLLFNLGLSIVWGAQEPFLYALHLQPMLLIVMLGIFRIPKMSVYLSFGALLVIEISLNFRSVEFMLSQLK